MRNIFLLGVTLLIVSHSHQAGATESDLPGNPLGYTVNEVADIYVGSNDELVAHGQNRSLLKHHLRGAVAATLWSVGLEMESSEATQSQIEWCFETVSSWDWGWLITNRVVDGVEDDPLPAWEAIFDIISAACKDQRNNS